MLALAIPLVLCPTSRPSKHRPCSTLHASFPFSDSTPTKPHAPARHRHVYLRSPSPAYDPAPAPTCTCTRTRTRTLRPPPPHRPHRRPARRGEGSLSAQDYRELVRGPGTDVPRDRTVTPRQAQPRDPNPARRSSPSCGALIPGR